MPKERSMISFDWAIKRLSELLRRDIAIKSIGGEE